MVGRCRFFILHRPLQVATYVWTLSDLFFLKQGLHWLDWLWSTGPFAHTFTCSILLAALTRSVALFCSLIRLLTHFQPRGKKRVHDLNASIFYSFNPLWRATSLWHLISLVFQRLRESHGRAYLFQFFHPFYMSVSHGIFASTCLSAPSLILSAQLFPFTC